MIGDERVLMGFYQNKKIVAELIKDGKRFDEVVDDGEQLLELHLLMNVRS